jgi:phosphatidate phosphatase PAH1
MSIDNTEVEINVVELDGVDWIIVAQDRDKILVCTNLKMQLSVA